MAAPLAVNSGASLWGPYKNIRTTVDNALLKRQPEAAHALDQLLKKHKTDFIALFKNPAKSPLQHEKIQKASTEGIAVKGQQGTRLLPESLINEAFILSDLFGIGEAAAVELLLAGEHQQPHFPGLPRGLVAVLLYWDGKRCLANSLCTLIRCRKGKTFTMSLCPEVEAMVTRFTDDLMDSGLTQKILTLVSQIDVHHEFDRLQKERGLGNERHRKEVSGLIKESRQSLAESLFLWACQTPLSKDDTLLLIGYLEKVSVEADGTLDSVNLYLLMALLYCFDVRFLEQGTEHRDELMQQMPLLTDKPYVAAVHQRLQDSPPWKLSGLQATVRLAWALALRGVSQLAEVTALAEFTEADEVLAEMAIGGNAFLFLTDAMVAANLFPQEEFFIRRIHTLVTDFLTRMPMKVKQLRNRAEEDARLIHMSLQMGNEPPSSLRRDLEHLLLLIGELYKNDSFHLELALEYWCPTEPLQSSTLMGSYLGVAHQRPPQRQVLLSKFVRQMSDLLPSTLYISYLKMLRGLSAGPQCAHYCFTFLKANGSSHAENLQAGSPVSWDHFFHSLMLYHEHLRRDNPSIDIIHQRHPLLRGITQREMDGLMVFLQLTTTVIEWSESARLALCEHTQWTPVIVILGLLQCSIPPVLKAELLKTLTAFGKSPEIAASLWQSLEHTQILQTVRPIGQRQAAGIEVELNEIESRAEEYPLTRAFCNLIGTLVESYFPANLGAGLRAPGFDPYLQFLRDSVFLRFRTRAYRRAAEKWEVAEAVLDVFYKLLRDYEPQPEDFVDQYVEMQGEEKAAYKPPGFSLMHHLLNESPMLELCLSLLEEGVVQLDTYAPFPGKTHLEKAVTCCFKLLNLTLQKENLFMDLLRKSHLSLIVTPLEQLLQGINPRSKKADHVVNIARYLFHGSTNPELAFESSKILCSISNNANIQAKIVGDFTQDSKISQRLMAGFVECLDSEESEEVVNPLEEIEEKNSATVYQKTKIHILNLLINSLEMKPPNLALYLLGFELKKPVSTTNLQESGVLGFPRTCLHSILDILKKETYGRMGPAAVAESPHLAELCYQVIHQLCACADTSGPTMRYLRTSQDFLVTQLHHLPFSMKGHEISALNQMSWLMKTASIELRITSLNRQRSHTQRLLNLLLDDVPVRPYIADSETGMEDDNRGINAFLHFDTSSKVRRKILSILDAIDFTQEIPEQLQIDYFDRILIEQVITKCEHKTRSGQTVCNIKHLRRILVAEINSVQAATHFIGQRPLLLEEINTILQYAVERNKMFQCLYAKHHALESWRQLVEVILTACPQDLIPAEQRQLIIRDLLQDLHDKILDDEATKELMPVVSWAVFTLTVHLSQSIRTEQKQQPLSARGGGQSQYVLMLDGSFAAPAGSDSLSAGFASIGDSSLHMILRKLLEFILKTGGGLQKVRMKLYGALLYYLQIAQRPDEPDTLEAAKKTMWERLTAPEDMFSKLQRDNLSIFETYGAALMEVICRDSCDGREISRMVALALLDRIVCVDKQQQWLAYLCNSGYLQALVDSLAEDDVTLQNLLSPQPPLLKALYIYESKMAFLTRVAKSQQGALELLRAGVILRLAQCQVFDMRPDTDQQGMYTMRETTVFIPTPLERYREILLSALHLCQVILTSTKAQHIQVAGQVLQFLIAHSDTIHTILRSKDGSLGSLQELALLTGIISKAALPEVVNDLASDLNEGPIVELHGHVGRFLRLCLFLLTRFVGSDKTRQLGFQDDGAHVAGVSAKDDVELVMQRICANVMEYCHTLMLQNSPNMVSLFTPSLMEGGSGGGSSREASRLDTQPSLFPSWRLPSLGVVLSLLKQSSSDFFAYYDIHRQSVSKLQNVEQLPPDEIKELCQSETPIGVDKISTTQKYVLARRRLVKLINSRAKLLSVCCYIIETCLFVLWRHLEYFLLQCTPSDGQDPLFSSASFTSRRFQETLNSDRNSDLRTPNRVSQQDVEMLLREGANLFGESLQKRLLEIESMYCKVRSRHSFIQVLLRRIRGLLRVPRA